jgi:hypothetical protein
LKSQKVLKPGQPGTKKWLEKYGESLYYVRHRYDRDKNLKFVTVELVVEEKYYRYKHTKIAHNKLFELKIEYHEKYLRKLVKEAGGRWNILKKVWELSYGEILKLGLRERIIQKE